MSASTHASATPAPRPWLRRCASLELTLLLLAWLALAVVYAYRLTDHATWSVAAPLAALASNLIAAVATHPVFRRQAALLVFHLALIALALLLAAGRLIELRGRLEVTQGERFGGELVQVDAGPLHPWQLPRADFVNDGFEIDYAAGYKRGPTRNRVRWSDDGIERTAVIGDQVPLVIHGYRFYTSPNKGFAARLRWQRPAGALFATAVHFPAYPVFQYGQTVEWNLPDSNVVLKLKLELPEKLIDPDAASRFALPARHRLLIDDGSGARELVAGAALPVAGGALVYEGLTTWMGYTVIYDPTTAWLLAACVVAIASLGWHFRRKFAARPWSAE
jgi:cytochrome c biogenesis protein